MINLHPALEAAIVFLLFTLILAMTAEAQEIAYCKNYETGEIIVIEAGYPCPFPTVQL